MLTLGTDTAQAREVIEGLVRRRLEGVDINSVRVEEAEDFDGDPIFEVTVIFKAKSKLDAAIVASMVRHMRSELYDKLSETRFPIISYVSQSDAKKLGFEAQ